MARGIVTDNNRYKHKKRNDVSWLTEDLHAFNRTVEKYRLRYFIFIAIFI